MGASSPREGEARLISAISRGLASGGRRSAAAKVQRGLGRFGGSAHLGQRRPGLLLGHFDALVGKDLIQDVHCTYRWLKRTRSSSFSRAAPLSSDFSASSSPARRSPCLGGQRGGGVEQHHVAARAAVFAAENGRAGWRRFRPARRRAGHPAERRAGRIGGVQREGVHLAVLQVADAVRPGGGQFVQAARAVHHEGRLPAQLAQHLGHGFGQRRVVDADELSGWRRPGWSAGRAG